MAKPRVLVDNGHYHVINRGNNGLNIFDAPNSYQTFKFILFESKKKFAWKLFHYCLMSNHFHLLLRVENGIDLPRMMQSILLKYSYWYKGARKYTGQLWQHRYRSPLIDQDSYLLECGRYIERNPVRAGIVGSPGDYEWSSYKHYAFGEKDPIIDTDPSFLDFGNDTSERCQKYRNFVALEGPYDFVLDQTLSTIKSRV